MNVNALLVGTLDSLLPTADSVYKGAATEYIVFNYTCLLYTSEKERVLRCECFTPIPEDEEEKK